MKFKQIREVTTLSISVLIEKLIQLKKESINNTLDLSNKKIREELKNSLGIVIPNKSMNKTINGTIHILKELKLIEIKDNILTDISNKINVRNKNNTGLDEKIRKTIYSELNKLIKDNGLTQNGKLDIKKLEDLVSSDLKKENPDISIESIKRTTRFYKNLFKEAIENKIEKIKVKKVEIEEPKYKELSLF